MDDHGQKIRKLLNNEETHEIAKFLFQLPLADFKFWGGLIQEAYEAKLQKGSGALEALKRKEIRKETAKLTTEIETLTKNIDELTNQLSQEKREHNEKLKTLENELKQVRNEKDSTQVKSVSMELKHIGALTFLFPRIRIHEVTPTLKIVSATHSKHSLQPHLLNSEHIL